MTANEVNKNDYNVRVNCQECSRELCMATAFCQIPYIVKRVA